MKREGGECFNPSENLIPAVFCFTKLICLPCSRKKRERQRRAVVTVVVNVVAGINH
jgi:hypothetical protein